MSTYKKEQQVLSFKIQPKNPQIQQYQDQKKIEQPISQNSEKIEHDKMYQQQLEQNKKEIDDKKEQISIQKLSQKEKIVLKLNEIRLAKATDQPKSNIFSNYLNQEQKSISNQINQKSDEKLKQKSDQGFNDNEMKNQNLIDSKEKKENQAQNDKLIQNIYDSKIQQSFQNTVKEKRSNSFFKFFKQNTITQINQKNQIIKEISEKQIQESQKQKNIEINQNTVNQQIDKKLEFQQIKQLNDTINPFEVQNLSNEQIQIQDPQILKTARVQENTQDQIPTKQQQRGILIQKTQIKMPALDKFHSVNVNDEGRSKSIIDNQIEEKQQEENYERGKWSVLARLMMVQQKLNEVNLNEELRDRDQQLNFFKFEIKNLDQELIMIKIESALLKCQIEESIIEQLEIQKLKSLEEEKIFDIELSKKQALIEQSKNNKIQSNDSVPQKQIQEKGISGYMNQFKIAFNTSFLNKKDKNVLENFQSEKSDNSKKVNQENDNNQNGLQKLLGSMPRQVLPQSWSQSRSKTVIKFKENQNSQSEQTQQEYINSENQLQKNSQDAKKIEQIIQNQIVDSDSKTKLQLIQADKEQQIEQQPNNLKGLNLQRQLQKQLQNQNIVNQNEEANLKIRTSDQKNQIQQRNSILSSESNQKKSKKQKRGSKISQNNGNKRQSNNLNRNSKTHGSSSGAQNEINTSSRLSIPFIIEEEKALPIIIEKKEKGNEELKKQKYIQNDNDPLIATNIFEHAKLPEDIHENAQQEISQSPNRSLYFGQINQSTLPSTNQAQQTGSQQTMQPITFLSSEQSNEENNKIVSPSDLNLKNMKIDKSESFSEDTQIQALQIQSQQSQNSGIQYFSNLFSQLNNQNQKLITQIQTTFQNFNQRNIQSENEALKQDQKELKHAKEFFQYFQNKHSEKQTDQWIKNYLPCIKSGDFLENKKLKIEIMKGNVPMCYRGEMWQQLIGNGLRLNCHVFETYKSEWNYSGDSEQIYKSKQISSFQDNNKQQNSQLILKDIPRTFPHLNQLFEEIHSLSKSLVDVLGAFQNFRPDVGYVQGMCFVAATLLIHQTRPEECFISFCNLIHKFDLLFNFYKADANEMLKTYKVFWRLIKENTPILYQNLKDNDATLKMLLLPWIITLFSNSFDIDMCAVIWDQIFYYGQFHILRVAVAIFQIIEKKFKNQIQSLDDQNEEKKQKNNLKQNVFEFVDAQLLIKNAKEHVSLDELLTVLKNQKISTSYIHSLYMQLPKKF